MKVREANLIVNMPDAFTDEGVSEARSILAAACDVWEARRALIEQMQRNPFSAVGVTFQEFQEERTRLALELSKAEARLIALEDAP